LPPRPSVHGTRLVTPPFVSARRYVPAGVVAAAQRGDRRALEHFFCTHLPLLQQWARGRVPRWLTPRADADDFVQLAAVKTLQRLHHLSPQRADTVQPYLRQTLLNLVRDEIRKVRRSGEAVELGDPESPELSALDALIERANWASYRLALRRLSASERIAVTGRIQRGLSYEALREPLGVPTANAARARVGRALKHVVMLMLQETTANARAVATRTPARSRGAKKKTPRAPARRTRPPTRRRR
jgi:RNA polymerase sigma factor (sigma-70 family)